VMQKHKLRQTLPKTENTDKSAPQGLDINVNWVQFWISVLCDGK